MAENALKKSKVSARDRILAAAWDLFHAQGIHDTSVTDILEQSETGKSQFYHYFGSKEGLIQAVLEDVCSQIEQGAIAGLQRIESWEGLRRWFDFYIARMEDFSCQRACPIGRFSAELSEDDEEIRRYVLSVFEAVKRFPRDFFMDLQERGALCAQVDPSELADFCEAVAQGGAILAKTHRDVRPLKVSLEHAFAYLQSFKR